MALLVEPIGLVNDTSKKKLSLTRKKYVGGKNYDGT